MVREMLDGEGGAGWCGTRSMVREVHDEEGGGASFVVQVTQGVSMERLDIGKE